MLIVGLTLGRIITKKSLYVIFTLVGLITFIIIAVMNGNEVSKEHLFLKAIISILIIKICDLISACILSFCLSDETKITETANSDAANGAAEESRINEDNVKDRKDILK